MKHVHLDKEMGDAVLRHLGSLANRDLTRIPAGDLGIVAGQAVASAVEELFFEGKNCVYNDIDVFDAMPKSSAYEGMPESTTGIVTPFAVHNTSAVCTEPYERLFCLAPSFAYRVLWCAEDGLINYIRVARGVNLPEAPRQVVIKRILSSFDFNCVQVAVDLTTKELIWTEQFEEFLRTRQLEVASTHTPWHTAIRFVKKLNELPNAYGDIGRTMRQLVTVASMLRPGSDPRREQHLRFGEKFKKKFEAHREVLQEWFDVVPALSADGKITFDHFYTLTPNIAPDEETLEILGLHLNVQPVIALISRYLMMAQKESVAVRLRFLLKRCPKLDILWTTASSPGELLKRAMRTQFAQSDLMAVQKLLEKHGDHLGGYAALLAQELQADPFEIAIQLTRLVKRYEREQGGEWIVGLVENLTTGSELIGLEELQRRLDESIPRERAELERQLRASYLPAPVSVCEVTIRELLSRRELMTEGSEMHHCVGGYGSAVANGSAILALASTEHGKTLRSTLELRWDATSYAFRTVQHRGFGNSTPPASHTKAVEQLLAASTLERQRLGWKFYLWPLLLCAHDISRRLASVQHRILSGLERAGIRRRNAGLLDMEIPF